MKKTTNHLAIFDTPESLVVVSLYPKKGETYSRGTTGVASYTKNLVTAMNRPVVVLANELSGAKTYKEKNTLVMRCFTPNTLEMWIQLIRMLNNFKQAKKVLIQFDFSMYGNMLTSAMILPFMAWLKFQGYQASIVSHHVIQDVNKLSGHLGLGQSFGDAVKAKLYNLAFATFYRVLGLTTASVIVLEETLKQAMGKYMDTRKVIAIPHAVDTHVDVTDKKHARRRLGYKQNEQIVMFFGFVNWFKGADFFTSAFQNVDTLNGKPVRFILAGGESVTLKQKEYYRRYFSKVLKTVDNSHRVEITGYVPQEKIKDYFAATDLIIFPYRHFMCASGVLSLAFSYQTPFIVSDQLKTMFTAPDFSEALQQAKLTPEQISFRLTIRDIINLTEKVLANGAKRKLIKMGKLMRQYRSYENNAKLYESAVFADSSQPASVVGAEPYAYSTSQ